MGSQELFFKALALIGGLCLFLFGMNILGEGLERRAGNGLKTLLGKLTNSKIKGFLHFLASFMLFHMPAVFSLFITFYHFFSE